MASGLLPTPAPPGHVRPVVLLRDGRFEEELRAMRADALAEPGAWTCVHAVGCDRRLVNRVLALRNGEVRISMPETSGWPRPGPVGGDAVPDPVSAMDALLALPRVEPDATFQAFADRAAACLSAMLLVEDPDLHHQGVCGEGSTNATVVIEPDDGLVSMVVEPPMGSEREEAAWHASAALSSEIPIPLRPTHNGGTWTLDPPRAAVEGVAVALPSVNSMTAMRCAAAYAR